jgi:hypothetical protein
MFLLLDRNREMYLVRFSAVVRTIHTGFARRRPIDPENIRAAFLADGYLANGGVENEVE